MEYTYEKTTTLSGEEVILRSDGATIPCVEGNADHAEYLKSLEEPAEK